MSCPLTIEEHAEHHRYRYEHHRYRYEMLGEWQDRLAWFGLLKLMSKADIAYEIMRRPKSQQMKDRLRKARTGTKRSPETCRCISEAKRGKPTWTEERKRRLSEYMIASGKRPPPTKVGSENPFFGRKHSETTKNKISASKKLKSINTS